MMPKPALSIAFDELKLNAFINQAVLDMATAIMPPPAKNSSYAKLKKSEVNRRHSPGLRIEKPYPPRACSSTVRAGDS